ncbi:MAG TPA: hypothetical protein VGS19_04780 [Streptosporangiaceae bacterium]|nr:hypothetical protein [Streptosporangiaceae bacterium]
MRLRSRSPALCLVTVTATLTLATQGMPASAMRVPVPASPGVSPRAVGLLDCNGLSPIQRPLKPTLSCADPRGRWDGRFYENGHYIGHDEPSIRFVSTTPGSGNDMTFTERLPLDPKAAPTVADPGHDVTHWAELSIAPWFSTDVCDPNSAPLLPCNPRSDANAPHGRYPGGGAGFVELQFYPPGEAPFIDNVSCDGTHWCSALNIDSLECQGSGNGACNNNCVEPVNFAFIQTNGVPTGPPSPQLADLASSTPDSHTLLMHPGDMIRVHMWDATIPGGHALEVSETDLATGQRGFMIASAANGFMNTNPFNCKGHPFNFQPEYSTARAANILPWGVGPYMVNTEYEIGHFEPCTSASGPAMFHSGSFADTYYKHCAGPYEGSPDGPGTFEPNDAPCFPAGDTHGGTTAPNIVTGCDVYFGAIGDLDYDGTPYWADWPDSTKAGPFPSPFLQQQPVTAGGRGYSQIQFETDASATEFNSNCNPSTGAGCVLPPRGPGHFYPYWTLAKVGGACVWEFGAMGNGNAFGGDQQYGSVGPGTIGAFASQIQQNPHC